MMGLTLLWVTIIIFILLIFVVRGYKWILIILICIFIYLVFLYMVRISVNFIRTQLLSDWIVFKNLIHMVPILKLLGILIPLLRKWSPWCLSFSKFIRVRKILMIDIDVIRIINRLRLIMETVRFIIWIWLTVGIVIVCTSVSVVVHVLWCVSYQLVIKKWDKLDIEKLLKFILVNKTNFIILFSLKT